MTQVVCVELNALIALLEQMAGTTPERARAVRLFYEAMSKPRTHAPVQWGKLIALHEIIGPAPIEVDGKLMQFVPKDETAAAQMLAEISARVRALTED